MLWSCWCLCGATFPTIFLINSRAAVPLGGIMRTPRDSSSHQATSWFDFIFFPLGLLFFSFFSLFQNAAAHHNTCPDSIFGYTSHIQPCDHGQCPPCCALHRQRHSLLLLLRHGLWADPQHSLLRDLSHKRSRCLHCHLRHDILDRGHHRHIQPPRHAEFHRPCRCVWDLRGCVCHLIGVCVFEGSWNQGHAPWSHYRVLCGRCEAGNKKLNKRQGAGNALAGFIWCRDDVFNVVALGQLPSCGSMAGVAVESEVSFWEWKFTGWRGLWRISTALLLPFALLHVHTCGCVSPFLFGSFLSFF